MLEAATPAVRAHVARVVEQHRAELAEDFYQDMMAHRQAQAFLDADIVHQRLHASLQRWLTELFAAHTAQDMPAIVAHQRHVGEVHARIQLPMHLVARGARLLKGQLLQRIATGGTAAALVEASMAHIGALFDLALELMAESYVRDTQRVVRSEEAFRLRALSQNLQVERERQRSLLAEWGQDMLFALHRGGAPLDLPRLGSSEFGLWFTHKGSNLFDGTPEVDLVHQAMERLDDALLPQLESGHGDAPYGGHPDYQYLINQADEALYRAKHGGRNRVCLATGAA